MDRLPNEILNIIMDNLSILDLSNCHQTCHLLHDFITENNHLSTIINHNKDKMKIYNFDTLTSEKLLLHYLETVPNYDYQYIITTLLPYHHFHLIDLILSYLSTQEREQIKWNDYLFISSCQGNEKAINYCISKGANNFIECYFAAKLYQHSEVISFFNKLKEQPHIQTNN